MTDRPATPNPNPELNPRDRNPDDYMHDASLPCPDCGDTHSDEKVTISVDVNTHMAIPEGFIATEQALSDIFTSAMNAVMVSLNQDVIDTLWPYMPETVKARVQANSN